MRVKSDNTRDQTMTHGKVIFLKKPKNRNENGPKIISITILRNSVDLMHDSQWSGRCVFVWGRPYSLQKKIRMWY